MRIELIRASNKQEALKRALWAEWITEINDNYGRGFIVFESIEDYIEYRNHNQR